MEADAEGSFVFVMRHILRVLALLTISKKNPHISAFHLEADGYKWFVWGGGDWQVESILLAVDTFLNTVEK